MSKRGGHGLKSYEKYRYMLKLLKIIRDLRNMTPHRSFKVDITFTGFLSF